MQSLQEVLKQTNFLICFCFCYFSLCTDSVFSWNKFPAGFRIVSRCLAFCSFNFTSFLPMSSATQQRVENTQKTHFGLKKKRRQSMHNKDSSTKMVNCLTIPSVAAARRKTRNNENRFASFVSKWKRRIINRKLSWDFPWIMIQDPGNRVCTDGSRILNDVLGVCATQWEIHFAFFGTSLHLRSLNRAGFSSFQTQPFPWCS